MLTSLALSFGPAEYFSLILLGLIITTVLAEGNVLKPLAMIAVGVALGLAGTDVQSGQVRFTFGFAALFEGISFVALAMGVFGVAEIIKNLERPEDRAKGVAKVSSLMLTREEVRRSTPAVLRGTAVGSILGILPGAARTLDLRSYLLEQKVSRYRHEFGQVRSRASPVPRAPTTLLRRHPSSPCSRSASRQTR